MLNAILLDNSNQWNCGFMFTAVVNSIDLPHEPFVYDLILICECLMES